MKPPHCASGESVSRLRSVLVLAGFEVVTFCAPLAGVRSMPDSWYAELAKPAWNPPAWIFGPVWTFLYASMAVAAWLVWKRVGWAAPIRLYFVQLTLNAAWTPVFFGAHEPGWALLVIVALWIAILLTMLSFQRVRRSAGLLIAPYLAWVTFATILNLTLWRMNP
jgi:benzodiazapine receptor